MARLLIGLTNVVIGIAEALLAMRLVLRLFAANPATPFVAWIYDVTAELLYPFRGIFPTAVLDGGYVLELSTLFAILAYAFLGFLLVELVAAIAGRRRT